MKEVVSQGQVYKGSRVVVAQAMSQVLHNIQPFINSSQDNVLIMYSPKANENGIAAKISDVTQNWSEYTFVFSKVAGVPDSDISQMAQSFKHLEISNLGLGNIFRCYEPGDDSFQCNSCSSGGGVSSLCVSNAALSNQKPEADVEITAPEISRDMGTEVMTGGRGGEELPTGQQKDVRMKKCKGHRKGQCTRAGKRKKGGRMSKGKRGNKGLKKDKSHRGGKGRRNKSLKKHRSRTGGKGRRNKVLKWVRSRKGGKGKRGRKSRGRRGGLENDWVLLSLE